MNYLDFHDRIMLQRPDLKIAKVALSRLCKFGGWDNDYYVVLLEQVIKPLAAKVQHSGFPTELEEFGLAPSEWQWLHHKINLFGLDVVQKNRLVKILQNIMVQRVDAKIVQVENLPYPDEDFHRRFYKSLQTAFSRYLLLKPEYFGINASFPRGFSIYLGYEVLLYLLYELQTEKQRLDFQNQFIDRPALADVISESLKLHTSKISEPEPRLTAEIMVPFNLILNTLQQQKMAWLACACKEYYLYCGHQFIIRKNQLSPKPVPNAEKVKLLEPETGNEQGLKLMTDSIAAHFLSRPFCSAKQFIQAGLDELKVPGIKLAIYKGRPVEERHYYQYSKPFYVIVENELNTMCQAQERREAAGGRKSIIDLKFFSKLVFSYLNAQLRLPDDRHEKNAASIEIDRLIFDKMVLVNRYAVNQNLVIIKHLRDLHYAVFFQSNNEVEQ